MLTNLLYGCCWGVREFLFSILEELCRWECGGGLHSTYVLETSPHSTSLPRSTQIGNQFFRQIAPPLKWGIKEKNYNKNGWKFKNPSLAAPIGTTGTTGKKIYVLSENLSFAPENVCLLWRSDEFVRLPRLSAIDGNWVIMAIWQLLTFLLNRKA